MYYNSSDNSFRCYQNGAWTNCVSGGRTKTIVLDPEYEGMTLVGDGTSNSGVLTSDFCSDVSGELQVNTSVCTTANDNHNYFSWTTSESTAQDYDIYVRYKLPSDFDNFSSSTSIKMFGWRNSTGSSVDLEVYRANSGGLTECGSSTNVATDTASTWTWTETNHTGDETSCSFSASDTILFRISLTATQDDFARAGAITFDYDTAY
jgi:hypothetical protein